MKEVKYIIELRNGSFFQSLKAPNGGPRQDAKQFSSKANAEHFMDANPWIYANGGMVVRL